MLGEGLPGPIPEDARAHPLNSEPVRPGSYVLYWMQASQRGQWNHALDYAVAWANHLKVPAVCCFGLTSRFPGANLRHYQFMLEGLRETREVLRRRGIDFEVYLGEPPAVAERLGALASMVVIDRGYLRIQRGWREDVARALRCRCVEVETDVVVPIKSAYQKLGYSAAVLRPRVGALLSRFLVPPEEREPILESRGMIPPGIDLADPERALTALPIDRAVPPSPALQGGVSLARGRLDDFLERDLPRYEEARNDPTADATSRLSPYLHFGQISAQEVAMRARATGLPSAPAFLEELIVRRELARNYAWFNPWYDAYAGVPSWARRSLERHAEDRRPYLYSPADLEAARTHDPAWNAAQLEMRLTGRMHGYMRMYWGKKIIEWSPSPAEAFEVAVALNDRYQLDGRDPNGYAGISWCFGTHDRPWKERPVFGSVRYMNDRGLRRKFDVDAYVRRVEVLSAAARSPVRLTGDEAHGA